MTPCNFPCSTGTRREAGEALYGRIWLRHHVDSEWVPPLLRKTVYRVPSVMLSCGAGRWGWVCGMCRLCNVFETPAGCRVKRFPPPLIHLFLPMRNAHRIRVCVFLSRSSSVVCQHATVRSLYFAFLRPFFSLFSCLILSYPILSHLSYPILS